MEQIKNTIDNNSYSSMPAKLPTANSLQANTLGEFAGTAYSRPFSARKKKNDIMRNLILICFVGISTSIQAQIELQPNFEELDKFCCLEWIIEFRDTIELIVDEQNVPPNSRYCVISQKKNTNFWCWTGINGLESPTTFKNKLKLKIKNDKFIFKFRSNKFQYTKFIDQNGKIKLAKN